MSVCSEAIYSNEYADFILDYLWEHTNGNEVCSQRINERYSVVQVPRKGAENWERYGMIPKLYGLMAEGTEGFEKTGNYAVQRPPLSLTGRGVVVAFADTGINYADDLFRNADGSSRILAIWDQTIEEGPAPEGFQYGTEYTKEQIDQALLSERPYETIPSGDQNGHGTALASVAAGRGNEYRGAAPDADLVVVKLKEAKPYLKEYYLVAQEAAAYQENDLMAAISYIQRFNSVFERPVVLCIGVGTNQGDHTGQAPLSQYLNETAQKRGMAVVVCGGNEGNAAHHYRGELLQTDYGQSGFLNRQESRMEIRVSEGCQGFCMELWGVAPDSYTVLVQTPGGEQTPEIRYGLGSRVEYSFIFERSSIAVESLLSEGSSGEELIFFRFVTPTPGIWTVRVTSVEPPQIGVFHAWLPISAFLNVPVYFLSPNPYVTLTEPGMAESPITVSTYNAANNGIYINSGRGYTRIGGINPQMAAPGVSVATGRGTMTGSGIAAAMAAGTVAQFMQWAVVEKNIPLIESRQLKSIFIRGAARERDIFYPDRQWGAYGNIVSGRQEPVRLQMQPFRGENCHDVEVKRVLRTHRTQYMVLQASLQTHIFVPMQPQRGF